MNSKSPPPTLGVSFPLGTKTTAITTRSQFMTLIQSCILALIFGPQLLVLWLIRKKMYLMLFTASCLMLLAEHWALKIFARNSVMIRTAKVQRERGKLASAVWTNSLGWAVTVLICFMIWSTIFPILQDKKIKGEFSPFIFFFFFFLFTEISFLKMRFYYFFHFSKWHFLFSHFLKWGNILLVVYIIPFCKIAQSLYIFLKRLQNN